MNKVEEMLHNIEWYASNRWDQWMRSDSGDSGKSSYSRSVEYEMVDNFSAEAIKDHYYQCAYDMYMKVAEDQLDAEQFEVYGSELRAAAIDFGGNMVNSDLTIELSL